MTPEEIDSYTEFMERALDESVERNMRPICVAFDDCDGSENGLVIVARDLSPLYVATRLRHMMDQLIKLHTDQHGG